MVELTIPILPQETHSVLEFYKGSILDLVKEKEFRIYCLVLSQKEVFKKIVLHFKERLGDLCTIKVAPTRKFVGHPLRGVEVHINTDDTELIKERIDGMFDGRCIDYRKK